MSLGKLTHDNPCCPKTVYRMQNAKGKGPYAMPKNKNATQWLPPSESAAQRSPFVDFSPTELRILEGPKKRYYKRKSAYTGRGPKFAFRRPQDVTRWFSKTQLKWLSQNGFKITPVKASKVWLSKTGRQVMFRPFPKTHPKKCRRVRCPR